MHAAFSRAPILGPMSGSIQQLASGISAVSPLGPKRDATIPRIHNQRRAPSRFTAVEPKGVVRPRVPRRRWLVGSSQGIKIQRGNFLRRQPFPPNELAGPFERRNRRERPIPPEIRHTPRRTSDYPGLTHRPFRHQTNRRHHHQRRDERATIHLRPPVPLRSSSYRLARLPGGVQDSGSRDATQHTIHQKASPRWLPNRYGND